MGVSWTYFDKLLQAGVNAAAAAGVVNDDSSQASSLSRTLLYIG